MSVRCTSLMPDENVVVSVALFSAADEDHDDAQERDDVPVEPSGRWHIDRVDDVVQYERVDVIVPALYMS